MYVPWIADSVLLGRLTPKCIQLTRRGRVTLDQSELSSQDEYTAPEYISATPASSDASLEKVSQTFCIPIALLVTYFLTPLVATSCQLPSYLKYAKLKSYHFYFTTFGRVMIFILLHHFWKGNDIYIISPLLEG